MKKTVKCPICRKLVEYSTASQYRPFCSEQCKLIDLGAWAEEQYKISTTKTSQSSQQVVTEYKTKH